jgi:hypothetical protein
MKRSVSLLVPCPILNAVFLIAEHKRAAMQDAVWAPLQQENSPALAHSSRVNFPADIPLVLASVMFIEPLKVRIKKMATQTLKLNVKSGEKDGKNFWDRCGVLFVNTDDSGNITSINVKHSMFPDVEMVAFPRRDNEPVTEWTQRQGGLSALAFRAVAKKSPAKGFLDAFL